MFLQPIYEDASYFLTINPIAQTFKELNIASKKIKCNFGTKNNFGTNNNFGTKKQF